MQSSFEMITFALPISLCIKENKNNKKEQQCLHCQQLLQYLRKKYREMFNQYCIGGSP